MATGINALLEKFLGLRVIPVKKEKPIDYKKTEPWFIELIGVPGVGKTTLLKELKNAHKNRSWITIKEFKKTCTKKINDSTLDSERAYQKLAKSKIKRVVNGNPKPVDQLNSLKWASMVLKDDALVHLYNKQFTIITDEGIFHNFKGVLTSDFQNGIKFSNFIANRAVIYCYAPAEIVAQRIIKRQQQTGKLVAEHKVGSKKELILVQKKLLENFHSNVDKIKEIGVIVLSVDTSEESSVNLKKIQNFINQLQTS